MQVRFSHLVSFGDAEVLPYRRPRPSILKHVQHAQQTRCVKSPRHGQPVLQTQKKVEPIQSKTTLAPGNLLAQRTKNSAPKKKNLNEIAGWKVIGGVQGFRVGRPVEKPLESTDSLQLNHRSMIKKNEVPSHQQPIMGRYGFGDEKSSEALQAESIQRSYWL